MKGACSLGVDENTEILVPRCGHQLESEEGTTHAIFEILKACPPHSTTPDPVPGTPSDSGFCTQRGLAPRRHCQYSDRPPWGSLLDTWGSLLDTWGKNKDCPKPQKTAPRPQKTAPGSKKTAPSAKKKTCPTPKKTAQAPKRLPQASVVHNAWGGGRCKVSSQHGVRST